MLTEKLDELMLQRGFKFVNWNANAQRVYVNTEVLTWDDSSKEIDINTNEFSIFCTVNFKGSFKLEHRIIHTNYTVSTYMDGVILDEENWSIKLMLFTRLVKKLEDLGF